MRTLSEESLLDIHESVLRDAGGGAPGILHPSALGAALGRIESGLGASQFYPGNFKKAAALLEREGYLDFAASRLYYAMFYAAEALLLDRELSFSSHSAVIAAFGKEFAKSRVLDPDLHRYLLDAQDLRNFGDYGIGPGVKEVQVQRMARWAQAFLTAAEDILFSSE